jgi:hypothetical protein
VEWSLSTSPWSADESAEGILLGHRSRHRSGCRYSPLLNPVKRLRRVPRRRAAHNRVFDRLADGNGRSATACFTFGPYGLARPPDRQSSPLECDWLNGLANQPY